MDDIPGVHFIQGDFLDRGIHAKVAEIVGGGDGRVDTVLSDMMAPMSGVRSRDVAASLDLVMAATGFGLGTLRIGSGQAMESEKGKKVYEGGNMV